MTRTVSTTLRLGKGLGLVLNCLYCVALLNIDKIVFTPKSPDDLLNMHES